MFLVRNADEKQRRELDNQLYAPVDGSDDLSMFLAKILDDGDGNE